MDIQENIILAPYTTFHIGGPAKFFCVVNNTEELQEAITWAEGKNLPILILGGGSNMLVSDRGFEGLVIHLQNRGINKVEETTDRVTFDIAAGEAWDEVVKLAVDNGHWGIENLSHIPGLAGAFAVQNVGAYGQEASDVVVSVNIFDTHDKQIKTFTKEQCHFGYRRSIFNTEAKGRFVILSTRVQLNKIPQPNLEYGDLKKYFTEKSISNPTQQQIREAIVTIRDHKFPFPTAAKNGNAGSFFRGPILKPEQIDFFYQKIATNFGKEAVERLHAMSDRLMVVQGMKTPTAFLIELCELKGRQVGRAKVHEEHAAIVINETGSATAQDVTSLFTHVGQVVYQKTGVVLHIEPELIGFTEQEREQILDSVVEG